MNNFRKLLTSLLTVQVLLAEQASGGQDAVFSLPSGVRVEIAESKFKSTLLKIVGCNGRDACIINGHIPFGTDLGIPETYIKSITVSYQNRSYKLDASDMYNA